MTLFKITKLIHDRFGIFINPIDLKPKMTYLTIKARINRGRVMSNYTPEVIWDDYVEGCACCALNYGLEDDDE